MATQAGWLPRVQPVTSPHRIGNNVEGMALTSTSVYELVMVNYRTHGRGGRRRVGQRKLCFVRSWGLGTSTLMLYALTQATPILGVRSWAER